MGLTATPERTDGKDIVHWFDNRLPATCACGRHWTRVFCRPSTTSESEGQTSAAWPSSEAGMSPGASKASSPATTFALSESSIQSQEWVLDPTKMRALGFCAGVAHAQFMADQFNLRACPRSRSTEGHLVTRARMRATASSRRTTGNFHGRHFQRRRRYPRGRTILLLRPTESATVFLQQLGRGLRWAEGKTVLTVLDFIGQPMPKYRFDLRYRAIMGGTRQQLGRTIDPASR